MEPPATLVESYAERISWREDAACRDADPDLFFPVGTTGNAQRQIDEAKRLCRRCPRTNPVPGLGAGKRRHRWRSGEAPRKTSGARCGAFRGRKRTSKGR